MLYKVYVWSFFLTLLTISSANALEADTTEPSAPSRLFLSAENTQDIRAQENPTIVRSRLVTVGFDVLSDLEERFMTEPDGEHPLILNVFQDLEYTVLIQKIEKNSSGSYSWYGKLKDFPLSQVVLVVNQNMIFGNISMTQFSYQIRHISDGVHAIYKIDPTKFPPTSEPITPDIKSKYSPSPLGTLPKDITSQTNMHLSGRETTISRTLNDLSQNALLQAKPHISGGKSINRQGDEFVEQNSFSRPVISPDSVSASSTSSSVETQSDDDGSTIDLLVVYTAEARVVEGGTSAMDSLIDLAISETNAAYSNSGVSHVVRLVAKQEISFSESGFDFTSFLNSAQDGSISGLHELREANGADLVVVLVDGDDTLCGLAFLMTTVSSSFASFGYSVTQTNCATGNYTFGHEIGHNMSARHDRTADNTDGSPFDYNHGYLDNTNNFKTIMGTGSNTRIQYFSNPNVSFGGAVTGVAEGNALAADNRLTFQSTDLTVANFYQTVTSSSTSTSTVASVPNSERVISPYWQSDSESYTFIAVSHTSLSGMASQIGVTVEAIQSDGNTFGSSTSFTISSATTSRVFIVRSDHPSITSTSIPSAQFITGTSNFSHGFIRAGSVATSPTTAVGGGFRDVTMLSFWGTVVAEQNTTGFAMEFIGDMHDSSAAPDFNSAQGNDVSGPAAP
ncbi:MAG: hypothetical protein HOM97_08275 [Nitrospina sp.]|nr:hypothetical protein [Nitrospina sp.]MBT6346736.1 hypothetical protein [Nitrospina sp.]